MKNILKTITASLACLLMAASINAAPEITNEGDFKYKLVKFKVNSISIDDGDDRSPMVAWDGKYQLYTKVRIKEGVNWDPKKVTPKQSRSITASAHRRPATFRDQLSAEKTLSPSTRSCKVYVSLWDDDTHGDDIIDINPIRGSLELPLHVDTETGGVYIFHNNNIYNRMVGIVGQPITLSGRDFRMKDKMTATINFTIFVESETPIRNPFRFGADLTGYYSCNDGGHYYVRQVENSLYWFGEDGNGNWANAFEATLESAYTAKGSFYDVAKGRYKGRGPLTITVNPYLDGFKLESGRFGGTVWTRKSRLPRNLPGYRRAGFSAFGNINNLDGEWRCDDGGVYYTREVGGMLIWYGEGGLDSGGKAAFANVAFGTRKGNSIRMVWFDVPKGDFRFKGKGEFTLKVTSANKFKMERNLKGGFGGRNWERTR